MWGHCDQEHGSRLISTRDKEIYPGSAPLLEVKTYFLLALYCFDSISITRFRVSISRTRRISRSGDSKVFRALFGCPRSKSRGSPYKGGESSGSTTMPSYNHIRSPILTLGLQDSLGLATGCRLVPCPAHVVGYVTRL